MNSNNLNRPNNGVLGELESVKDTLHAVDGNIESLLSITADSDIPILEDVVSSDQSSDSCAEPSADDQLSLTNKYKTLSERDLEKAAAEAAVEQADDEPTLAAATQDPDEDLMLHLDELLIDDDLELGLDADFDLELETDIEPIATDTPPHTVEPRRHDDSDAAEIEEDCNSDPQEHSIMPDMELLNAELGVEPLPWSSSGTSPELKATAAEAANSDDPAVQTPAATPAINKDIMESAINADSEANNSAESPASGDKLDFGISTTTSFNISGYDLFGAAEPTPETPAPLEPEQLTKLIEMVVEAQIPALKRSLLDHLSPLLCQHPANRKAN